jgi:hypothetical protein
MSPSTDEIAIFTGRNYECVDTDSDIESCESSALSLAIGLL